MSQGRRRGRSDAPRRSFSGRTMTRTGPLALAISLLVIACGPPVAATPPPTGAASPVPSAASLSSAPPPLGSPPTVSLPSPTPAPSAAAAAPLSAGAVPDAGVLYVQGADDRLYRYDGKTGELREATARMTLTQEAPSGVYALGRHGGAALLGWDGSVTSVTCAGGAVVALAPTGACAARQVEDAADTSVWAKLPDEPAAREIVPADWGAGQVSWSPDGRRLLLVRWLRLRPGPGMDPGLASLWLLEADGRLREVYRPPSGQGYETSPRWSPDGKRVVFWEIRTTSNSLAADGVGIDAILLDLATGVTTKLGTVMSHEWVQWSPDGRLAFTEGGGRGTWVRKRLIVRDRTGAERVMSGEGQVGIAAAWGPHDDLAWVSGPSDDSLDGRAYLAGRGIGDRTATIAIGARRSQARCGPGRVVEGVRWSADASRLLLLCRVTGDDPLPLELWLYRLADGSATPLVRGLESDPDAHGFGYYGMQPPITRISAWSLGMRLP